MPAPPCGSGTSSPMTPRSARPCPDPRRRAAVVVERSRTYGEIGARSARNRRTVSRQQLLVVAENSKSTLVALLGPSATAPDVGVRVRDASGYGFRPCDCATETPRRPSGPSWWPGSRPTCRRARCCASRSGRAPTCPPWAREWQRTLFDAGWLVPGWPPELGGRNANPMQQMIYFEEMSRREIPRSLNPQGLGIIAPSIRDYGTARAARAVPAPDAAGRDRVVPRDERADRRAATSRACARARCSTATTSWSTGRRCGRPARTTPTGASASCARIPTLPKHKGISALIIDMKTPGVEARPFPELSEPDFLDFNEVFFTDARGPAREPARRAQRRLADHAGLARARAGDAVDRLRVQPRPRAAGARRARPTSSAPTAGGSATTRCSATRSPRIAIDAQALLCMGYRGFSKFMAGKSASEHSLLKLFGSESVQRALQIGIEAEGVAGLDITRLGPRCGARARGASSGCARSAARSPAARARSSATSSPSACSASRALSRAGGTATRRGAMTDRVLSDAEIAQDGDADLGAGEGGDRRG